MSKAFMRSVNKSLPVKSAWSKGPPQSVAHTLVPTLLRGPSSLGQATSFEDGMSIPSNIGAAAVEQDTFGSFDDTLVQILPSRVEAPPSIRDAIVRSFRIVPTSPVQPGPPEVVERDDAGLPHISSAPPASSSSDTQSPSLRSANPPAQIQTQGTPSSPSQFMPFVPSPRARPQDSLPKKGPNRYPSREYRPPGSPPQPRIDPPPASVTNDEENTMTKDKWIDVLKLSTKQRSTDLRTLAIHHISSIEMDPMDRISRAKEYKVYNWLLQGYEQVVYRLLSMNRQQSSLRKRGARIGLGVALKLSGIVIRRTRCLPATPMKDVKSDVLDAFREEFDHLRSKEASFVSP
ncbi:hypothetical protein BKA70DRAFT_1223893 [Coprinopsis sp. MPI-PUGE-AT-0042]|nr:hypothetical protein BKA70DRAFT_1223893 [Coprinopsis sp. MPI-PUGE-AT-0042]